MSRWIFVLVLIGVSAARAQVPPPRVTPAEIVERIGIDQKLNERVPGDLEFRDEAGRPVRLGDYFGDKPVVLSLVYYRCPSLCTMSLNGMLAAFKVLKFDLGREFQVVTVSFDPRETHEVAAAKKANYLRQYNRPGAEAGWHFLTGDEASIRALADAAGFRYYYDERTDQYAHAAGIMVLTPDGRLSRYFYGLEYSARDLRLGLIDAANGQIGTFADKVALFCYQYDPMTGKYGFAVMSSLRLGAAGIVVVIGMFILLSVRKERRARSEAMARLASNAGTRAGGPDDPEHLPDPSTADRPSPRPGDFVS